MCQCVWGRRVSVHHWIGEWWHKFKSRVTEVCTHVICGPSILRVVDGGVGWVVCVPCDPAPGTETARDF